MEETATSTIRFFVGGTEVDAATAQAAWVARAERQAKEWKQRDPAGFQRRCAEIEAHVMRRHTARIPPRMEARPAGRRSRGGRRQARAPARPDEPDEYLVVTEPSEFWTDVRAIRVISVEAFRAEVERLLGGAA